MTDQDREILATQLEIAGNALLTMRKILRGARGEPDASEDTGPRRMGQNAKPFAGKHREVERQAAEVIADVSTLGVP